MTVGREAFSNQAMNNNPVFDCYTNGDAGLLPGRRSTQLFKTYTYDGPGRPSIWSYRVGLDLERKWDALWLYGCFGYDPHAIAWTLRTRPVDPTLGARLFESWLIGYRKSEGYSFPPGVIYRPSKKSLMSEEQFLEIGDFENS